MKRTIRTCLFIMLILNCMMTYAQTNMIANPASVYCRFLGYGLENRKDADGNEFGVCIFPDGSECGEWDFYRGICGKQFSYCARKGCEAETIEEKRDGAVFQYAACSCTDSSGNRTAVSLMDFMERHGDTLIRYNRASKGLMIH